MTETKIFTFSQTDELAVQQLVQDPSVAINRLVLPSGQTIQPHVTQTRAYMIVTDGTLTLALDKQPEQCYEAGKIVAIGADTLLTISNKGPSTMRLFVIKPKQEPDSDGCR